MKANHLNTPTITGHHWNDIGGKPVGFDDGIDNIGYSTLAELQAAVSNDFHNLGGTDINTDYCSGGTCGALTVTGAITPSGGINADNNYVIKTEVIPLINWNMDAVQYRWICFSDYGIDYTKVINWNVIVRGDWDDRLARTVSQLPGKDSSGLVVGRSMIKTEIATYCPERFALLIDGGPDGYPFRSIFFDRTGGYVRGWVTVTYYV